MSRTERLPLIGRLLPSGRAKGAAEAARVTAVVDAQGPPRRKPAARSGGRKQRAELAALHARTGCPYVHVTHQQAKAMSPSDR
ncbi:MAG: hypothetical protein AAF968_26045 [Pseudomonadota bacterium]